MKSFYTRAIDLDKLCALSNVKAIRAREGSGRKDFSERFVASKRVPRTLPHRISPVGSFKLSPDRVSKRGCGPCRILIKYHHHIGVDNVLKKRCDSRNRAIEISAAAASLPHVPQMHHLSDTQSTERPLQPRAA